ncbi:MAG: NAD(P)/FAD-dependent oxidoreductase [Candidatus Marinamargulisbacteria bacterium]
MVFSTADSIDATQPESALIRKSPENNDLFDVIVVGSGPAGMSAAVCASRADLKTLVIEKALPGGECSTACRIDNFIGQPEGILGPDLGRSMEDQLFRHDIYYTCETVMDFISIDGPVKTVTTSLGHNYRTKTVILAIGLDPKKLNADFESRFLGQGISYYAQADPSHYHNKNAVVIGGGNCACYAADYLSKYVNHVYMVHNYDTIRAVKKLKQTIETNPKITIMWNAKVTELFGVDHVERVLTENIITGQSTWLDAQGVFIYIGRVPPQDIVRFDIELDEQGFIITDDCMRTNIHGVYAAGDIRSKQVRQIAPAVSDGMIAAINVERDFFR